MMVAAALAGAVIMAGLALGIAEMTRHVPTARGRHAQVGATVPWLPTAAPAPALSLALPMPPMPPAPVPSLPQAQTPSMPPASLRDALCDLSERLAEAGDPLPQITGIYLTTRSIDVLLSAPAVGPPPPPFSNAPGR